MIHEVDLTFPDGIRFRLKATLEKEKIANEEALSQAKKEHMTEVKVYYMYSKTWFRLYRYWTGGSRPRKFNAETLPKQIT